MIHTGYTIDSMVYDLNILGFFRLAVLQNADTRSSMTTAGLAISELPQSVP